MRKPEKKQIGNEGGESQDPAWSSEEEENDDEEEEDGEEEDGEDEEGENGEDEEDGAEEEGEKEGEEKERRKEGREEEEEEEDSDSNYNYYNPLFFGRGQLYDDLNAAAINAAAIARAENTPPRIDQDIFYSLPDSGYETLS